MKKSFQFFIIIVMIACFAVIAINLPAQTTKTPEKKSYALSANGSVTASTSTVKTPGNDSIVGHDGDVIFYRGAGGGVYYWKVSRNGNKYKCYLKKAK